MIIGVVNGAVMTVTAALGQEQHRAHMGLKLKEKCVTEVPPARINAAVLMMTKALVVPVAAPVTQSTRAYLLAAAAMLILFVIFAMMALGI